MNKCAIIVSGGTINEKFALAQIEKCKDRLIIGVDKGVEFLYRNGICPDYIVGDFDSLPPEIVRYYVEETNVPVRKFNPVKDASDTEIGVRMALELGCGEMKLLGATGTRLDHVLANIQILAIPHREGVHAEIIDPNNRIYLIEKEAVLSKKEMYGNYFSVFPLGGCVENFSIEGAKYPLSNHTLCPYDSLCVSNEAKEEKVKITFPKGTVILMETCDIS